MAALHIQFAKEMDFSLDDFNNLMVERRNQWGTTKEIVLVGPLTNHLINSMQATLERLRIHVKD